MRIIIFAFIIALLTINFPIVNIIYVAERKEAPYD